MPGYGVFLAFIAAFFISSSNYCFAKPHTENPGGENGDRTQSKIPPSKVDDFCDT